jgi:hypothetical protein
MSRFSVACTLLVAVAVLFFQISGKAFQGAPQVWYPLKDAGVESLAARARAQQETAGQFQVDYRFRFSDRIAESGITFVHHIVDDAGLNYKAVHYDHGNGIAAADVDGDGLPDLYFVNQVGGNELWKNLGGGRFRNITAAAGVSIPGRISVAASFADIDNDGDEDLYVTTVRGGNLLFENDGHGHFRDITRQAGVGLTAHSSGSTFVDYNNDGLVDLLVCNVGQYTSNAKGAQGQYVGLPDAFSGHMYPERFEHPVLFRNLGKGRFRDVTAEVGLKPHGWCGDAGFADLNEDGWPDLYFLNMMGANHYFENRRGRSFVEKTDQYFPKTSWGAMGLRFFDYDNDGRMDLFVTDMHSDMYESIAPEKEKLKNQAHQEESYLMGPPEKFVFGNSLYHNVGKTPFEEVSDSMGVENYWPWGPSSGDLNADGWEDLFIASSMNFPFRYGINSVLLNNRGKKFLDAEFLLGVEPRRDGRTHTPWFQMDCSKPPPDPRGIMHEICANQTGPVTVMAPLGSRSAVILDLDGDGDLDIVTNDFNSQPQILISDLAQRREISWLQVKLVGTASNHDGLGAVVSVQTRERTYVKYNDGKSGYLSQSSLPLYFGLGEKPEIRQVEVRWPSGRRQVINQGLESTRVLTVTEPK